MQPTHRKHSSCSDNNISTASNKVADFEVGDSLRATAIPKS